VPPYAATSKGPPISRAMRCTVPVAYANFAGNLVDALTCAQLLFALPASTARFSPAFMRWRIMLRSTIGGEGGQVASLFQRQIIASVVRMPTAMPMTASQSYRCGCGSNDSKFTSSLAGGGKRRC
jgi:hypothetical protein